MLLGYRNIDTGDILETLVFLELKRRKYELYTGKIGFISPLSHSFCANCNRVRLTSSGMLKLCLCHDEGLDVKKLLRSGESGTKLDVMLRKEIINVIKQKPEAHSFNQKGSLSHMMTEIGG